MPLLNTKGKIGWQDDTVHAGHRYVNVDTMIHLAIISPEGSHVNCNEYTTKLAKGDNDFHFSKPGKAATESTTYTKSWALCIGV